MRNVLAGAVGLTADAACPRPTLEGGMPTFAELQGMHAPLAHVPAVLFSLAPLLIALGLFARRPRALFTGGLAIMALATAGLWVAVGTGAAATQPEGLPGAVQSAIERHRATAEIAETAFIALTLAFAALLAAPWLVARKVSLSALRAAAFVFLLLYAAAAVQLGRAAQLGGRIPYELEVSGWKEPPAVANAR